ncbi:GNAT family N-acetyltransferase [Actinomadura rupiterrae]|uniref:GNAT family N-acetyltransferase n=1 Tax=Actinomadura rupiterrae TaxID=559627 RepID=UPI0020A31329|nr:GNAT family N-acetyltransferase [Actinomadura rupiterrae]MCP2338171.1 GNAT superfamily N-acetyltransferase [Actinomadura rupiterrae]
MSTDPYEIRPASPADLDLLPPIENSADRMFGAVGIEFPPGPTVVEQMIGRDAEILVAGDPPAGYAVLSPLDGATHLDQISVHADLTGQGIGTRILQAVLAHAAAAGSPGVSLLTFRDVPWNAPWYARHGFTELPDHHWTPGLRNHWNAEITAGLHTLGPRLIMWHPTT